MLLSQPLRAPSFFTTTFTVGGQHDSCSPAAAAARLFYQRGHYHQTAAYTLQFVAMIILDTRVQRFGAKLPDTRVRCVARSTIARVWQAPFSVVGKVLLQ